MSGTSRHNTIFSNNVPDVASVPALDARLLQIHPVDLQHGLTKLTNDKFIVGREPSCDLMIAEGAVSRQHARFEKLDHGFQVTDLNSTNGTWVNGESVSQTMLQSGDRIRIGGRIFKFMATDQIEADYHEAVYMMITRDSLTGAWNKRYFIDMLDRELKRQTRKKLPLSLVMIDADHFKSINDQHGHLVGDEVLAELSRRIRQSIREEDIFARFGGEEFAIILAETDLKGAVIVAERCRSLISSTPFETASGPLEVSISCGIAVSNEQQTLTQTQLIKEADENLYKAKADGRDRIVG